jgi:hypothetical protein
MSFDQKTSRFWEFRPEEARNPIVILFLQLLRPLWGCMHPYDTTKIDMIENPDIYSFKLRETIYTEYLHGACNLVDIEWFGHRNDMNVNANNKDYFIQKISEFINTIYADLPRILRVNSIDEERESIINPLLEYICGCFFFQIIANSKILPYVKYTIETIEYTEAYQFSKSLRNIIKRTYNAYEKLCEYECPSYYGEDDNMFPFKNIQLHYSEKYYNEMLFACSPDTNTHIIPFILANPKLYHYRKDTNFGLMIYGNPKASHGLYVERIKELEEMGAISK